MKCVGYHDYLSGNGGHKFDIVSKDSLSEHVLCHTGKQA